MSTTTMSRRRFLTIAGAAVGATTLTCFGVTALGTRQPSIDPIKTTFGEATSSKKILVAYASKAGSTASIAEAIAKTLAVAGAQVDVRPMKEVGDLTAYQAVVAGSAIRAGEWLPEAMDFVQTHQATLSQKPFAAFLVCMSMAYPEKSQEATTYLEPVRALVKPASEGLFAGVLDYAKLSPIDGLLMRAVGGDQPGDYRDWNAIRAWAESVHPILVA